MIVTFFDDPRAQLAAVEHFLLNDRVFNMHQLRILSRAAMDVRELGGTKDVIGGYTVTDGAGIRASALLTSRRGLFVSPLLGDADSARIVEALANEMGDRNELADIVGHAPSVAAIAEAVGNFRTFLSGTLYALERAPIFDFARAHDAGLRFRKAMADDAPQLIAWQHDFLDELKLKDPRDQVADNVHRRVESGQFFIAQADGEPAAYAGGTNVGHGIGSIGPVYTTPDCRGGGKKLGQAVTAFACAHLRTLGAETIVLLADVENPVSNAAYQRIGFTARGDFSHVERIV